MNRTRKCRSPKRFWLTCRLFVGKAGGDGGSVKIRLKERDAFLLMKVGK